MGRMPQSSIIVVGNEILSGFTVDTNSHWLAGRLFHVGYPVRLMTTVGAESEATAALSPLRERVPSGECSEPRAG